MSALPDEFEDDFDSREPLAPVIYLDPANDDEFDLLSAAQAEAMRIAGNAKAAAAEQAKPVVVPTPLAVAAVAPRPVVQGTAKGKTAIFTTPVVAKAENYGAVFTARGKEPLAPWAVEYLVKRNVTAEVAAGRGYFTGYGDLPGTGTASALHRWSIAAQEWAEGRRVRIATQDGNGNLNGDSEWVPYSNYVGEAEKVLMDEEDGGGLGEDGYEEDPDPSQGWMMMPTYPNGAQAEPIYQIRWQHPRQEQLPGKAGWSEAKKGKVPEPRFRSVKNEWPRCTDKHAPELERSLDFFDCQNLKDPDQVIRIAEGTPKKDALRSMGVTGVIGIPGIDLLLDGKANEANPSNLRSRVNPLVLAHTGPLKDRTVEILADADHRTSPGVMGAVRRMCSALTRAGASVRVVTVPTFWRDPETSEQINLTGLYGDGIGIDDFSAAMADLDPRTPWYERLVDESVTGRQYLVRTESYGTTDVAAGKRLEAMAVDAGVYFHVTEGDKPTGSWWTHSRTHWTVDADAKAISSLGIEAAAWVFGSDKDETKRLREAGEKKESISSAVWVARTHASLARPSTIWEPIEWSKHLSVNNGLLHLPTRTLIEHDPAALNLHASPDDYVCGYTHPVWDRQCRKIFITKRDVDGVEQWVYDPEMERTFQETMGAALYGRTFARWLIMLGEGGCGMGTMLRACMAVLGGYAGTMKSEEITGEANQFGASSIVHKRAAVAGEISEGQRLNGATIHTIVQDGEERAVERKNRDQGDAKNTATIFAPTNSLPRVMASAQENEALLRRTAILYFGRSIPEEEKDNNITDMLATPDVRRAILAWMVEGAARLAENGYKPYRSEDSVTRVKDWLKSGDRLQECLDEVLVPIKEGEPGYGSISVGVTVATVKDLYERWCTTQEIPRDFRIASRNLATKVDGILGKRKRANSKGTGAEIWRGYRVAQ